MKQAKGNVSILVMFIMIATSLMGLLAMHFVNQMMEYSSVVHNYYKTYYLTKAGLELGMTEANIRGLGFSTTINNDNFFKDNFLCWEKWRCEADAEVKGESSVVREKFWDTDPTCTKENAFHLKQWENLIVPLFYEKALSSQKENLETPDSAKKENAKKKNSSDYEALKNLATKSPQFQFPRNKTPKSINLGVVALYKNGDKIGSRDKNNNFLYYDSDVIFVKKIKNPNWDTIKNFLNWYWIEKWLIQSYWNEVLTNRFLYLLIGNGTVEKDPETEKITDHSEIIQLCIKAPKSSGRKDKSLPTQKFRITSKATYDDTTVSMQAKYKQALPSFFMNIWEL